MKDGDNLAIVCFALLCDWSDEGVIFSSLFLFGQCRSKKTQPRSKYHNFFKLHPPEGNYKRYKLYYGKMKLC